MNEKLTIDKYNKIYAIFDGLRSVVGITNEQLPLLFVPEGSSTTESIFERLCSSLQNSGQMSNSIKFNSDNRELIKNVVYNYNMQKFTKNYTKWEDVYDAFISRGISDQGKERKVIKNYNKNKPETNWEKYSKGLFEGVNYLLSGGLEKIRELISYSEKINRVEDAYVKEIYSISNKIHGLGFALTCDWLKECGCTWLAKPDTHIVEVYKHLIGMSSNSKVSEIQVIKDMFDYAELIKTKDTDMTTYKLDKMIWLICTGNFYQFDIQIGRDLIIKKVE